MLSLVRRRVPPAPTHPEAGRGRVRHPLVLTALLYLTVSIALNHRVLGGFTHSSIGWVTADADLFAWWLHWTSWSLAHGQDPLFTVYQHFPVGVNAMWNTTVPLLGLVFAPVTLTAGPVAAYNTSMILGPVVSGLAMTAALGRYVTRWSPRIVSGALYAFGPFHLAHMSVGHLNLVWSVMPAFLLYTVHILFARPLRQPVLVGALIGVVFAAQTVLYTQTLALGVLMLVVTAAVLAVRWPRRARQALPAMATAGLACVGTYAVLCAYPLYLILAGPARPGAQIRNPEYSGADAYNAIVPTYLNLIRPVPDGLAGRLQGHTGEQGGYIGIAVAGLLVYIVLTVRSTAIRIAATVGAIAFVLSLGPTLVLLGEHTGIPLPWRAVTAVPLLSQAEPVRLQIFVSLCIAMIVALWLDHVRNMQHRTERRFAIALTCVAVVSWLPADMQAAQSATSPTFFATASNYLAPADVVETYPRLNGNWQEGAAPLRWQLISGMAYRTTGGYFIGSDGDNDVLTETPWNAYQLGAREIAEGRMAPGDEGADAAWRELRSTGVTVVIVAPPLKGDLVQILDWTSRVTGTIGEQVDDVWLFRL